MKRKLSVGLVFALVLILVAGMALAVMSLRDTGRQVVENEQAIGYYEDWPADKRAELALALVAQGYAEETDAIGQLRKGSLPDPEAERVADEVLTTFTGKDVTEISFLSIMQSAWGSFDRWSKEEQAWYSQLMVDMGIQKDDHTLYVMPEGEITEDKAIAIAYREIIKGFGLEEGALSAYGVTTSFQVPEFSEPGDTQAYWYVELIAPENMPKEARAFNMFWVFVHPETGELLESVESMLAVRRAEEARRNDPLNVAMGEFEAEHGYFHSMSHDARAMWSQSIRPMVQQKQQDDPEFFADGQGMASTLALVAFVYGVPDERALDQDSAQALAERALMEVAGRDEAEIKYYRNRVNVYYDATDPEKPLWKFFFRMPSPHISDKALGKEIAAYYGDTRPLNYKVELDAYTGEVVRAFGIELGDVHSLEEWQQLY